MNDDASPKTDSADDLRWGDEPTRKKTLRGDNRLPHEKEEAPTTSVAAAPTTDQGTSQHLMEEVDDLVSKITDRKKEAGTMPSEPVDMSLAESGISEPQSVMPEKEKITPLSEEVTIKKEVVASAPEKPIESPKAPVKSYHSDMEHVMREGKGGTMASVLEDAREDEAIHENKSVTSKKNLVFLGLSVMFIALGAALLWFFVLADTFKRIPVEQTVPMVPSLVSADLQAGIDITGASPSKIETLAQQAIAQNEAGFQQMTHLYFKEGAGQNVVRANRKRVFQGLGITLPGALNQALTDDFMYGLYSLNKDYPFLVFNVSSFDRAFAGMREWEPTMLDDLKGLFAVEKELLDPSSFLKTFEDKLLLNKNMRVLSVPRIIEIEELIPVIPLIDDVVTDKEMPTEDIEGVPEESGLAEPAAPEELEWPEPEEEKLPDDEDGPVQIINEITEPIQEFQSVMVKELGPEEPVLIYTFLNEKTLIITSSPDVIAEINERLANRQIFQ